MTPDVLTEITDPQHQVFIVRRESQLPRWIDRTQLVYFFHDAMMPWQDCHGDITRGLDYAFSSDKGKGGFLLLMAQNKKLCGALVMLYTGMGGFVPENLLLFVAVDPSLRGKGMGTKLIEMSIKECQGSVKLHVDYDNPAKRLYERLGFKNKYAEMRLLR